ncbi:unnamed protein product [Mortierella alpina]
MFGNHDLVLKEANPKLVDHAFGRINIIKGHAVTVMNEPFVSLAVQKYFAAIVAYFAREVRKRMVKSSAIEQGCVFERFERFKMEVFSETFNTRPLSEWPHQPTISEMCPALVGKVEIVGWKEPGLEQDHAKDFRKYCPDNIYVSMIVAYPTKWTEALLAPSEVPKDSSGVRQVVMNVSDNNFGDIFPQEHVEFIDRLKNARKRSADNDDSNDEGCSKKSRS